MSEYSPTQEFFRKTMLFAAPLLLGLSTFFWNNGEYDTRGASLLIMALVCWIPVFQYLFSLTKPFTPRYSQWGYFLALYGCISGICFAFLGYITTVLGISHDAYIKALGQYPISSGVLLFWAGPLFPLSLLGLSGVLYRLKTAPGWVCILLAIGGILFPLSRIQRIEWLAHISDGLILAALSYFVTVKPIAQR